MASTEPGEGIITSSSDGPEPGAAGALTHRQILVIISGLICGMLLAALDMTIVSTSIRTIADDLDGLSVQAWVTTAYLITSTITTPLYGKLSDLYGRRPFFLTAISIFILGSLLSGAAQTIYQLAGARAIQGLGAGGLFSLALAIVGDIVPPRERAKYQGYFMAVFGSSSVLGPVVGGFFADRDQLLGVTGWRWVFLVNIPIGLIALVVVARVLHIPHTRREHRIDWPGALALILTTVPLLLVAEEGREWGWLSGGSIACYAVAVAGLAVFLACERSYGDDALLPLRLFRGRTFQTGVGLNLIIGMGMFGVIAILPLYMQIVHDYSPTQSGLLLLPMSAGIMGGSIASGQIIGRTGRYKIFPVMGAVLLLVGALLLSRLSADAGLAQIWGSSIVFGLGLGFNMQTLVLAVQNSVPPQDMGVATSSVMFFRQMGGTLGTAVFLSVLFGTVGDRIRDAFADLGTPPVPVNAADRALAAAQQSGGGLDLDNTSYIKQLSEGFADPIHRGFTSSIDLVFMITAAVLVFAVIIVMFLPEEKLRTQSGLQAREATTAAAAAESGAAIEGVLDAGVPAARNATDTTDTTTGPARR